MVRRQRARLRICIALLLCLPAMMSRAAAAPGAAIEPVEHAICRLIESSARANHLPVGFMTRIIWRESSFRAGAVSPVGALGIAQFMPGTAQQRGLADPFDPQQAIPEAARLLAALRLRFGNLGVAAAAYNAGPARVAFWLHGDAGLPAETRAYVRFVTARDVEDWTLPRVAKAAPAAAQSCIAVADELRREAGDADDVAFGPLAPWGVQLAGNFSKAVALASFERARRRYAAIIGDQQPMILGRRLRSRGTRRFYEVRLPAASRARADAVCRRIRSVGGACVAMHS